MFNQIKQWNSDTNIFSAFPPEPVYFPPSFLHKSTDIPPRIGNFVYKKLAGFPGPLELVDFS